MPSTIFQPLPILSYGLHYKLNMFWRKTKTTTEAGNIQIQITQNITNYVIGSSKNTFTFISFNLKPKYNKEHGTLVIKRLEVITKQK